MTTLEVAKQRLPLPELLCRLGLGDRAKKSARCPLHEDHTPSFGLYANPAGESRWKCHAGCGGGDSVEFIAQFQNISNAEACRVLIELAGVHGPLKRAGANQKLVLAGFHRGELHELHALARLRNVSVESVGIASNHSLIVFGDVLGHPSWIITDSKRIMAQARRNDGEDFPPIGNLSQRKAHTLRGSVGGWPVGAVSVCPGDVALLTEGGPDLLAACHFIWCEGREQDVAPVAMLGATQRINEAALPYLVAARHIRLFPHIDSSGRSAASNWTKQLRRAGAVRVDAFSFAGLVRSDDLPVKDLNDCTSVDYDCFERERSLWGIIP